VIGHVEQYPGDASEYCLVSGSMGWFPSCNLLILACNACRRQGFITRRMWCLPMAGFHHIQTL